jgi:hypothetical protein
MDTLSIKKLRTYRDQTFHTAPGRRVTSPAEAIEFVNERGFIYFWPIKEVLLPSLWVANAGDRPVPSDHDDPGHTTWGWKDDALDKKYWYYAKLLRRRATFVSLDVIPYFYALSPNYGDPDQDYLIEYQDGVLTVECKQIYEALLKEGPLDTLSLRKAAHLSNSESSGRFNKAVDDLQVELKVLPVGTAEVGAWKYAYVYDLTHRHFPQLSQQAHDIGQGEARRKLVEIFFRSVGAAQADAVTKLFHWRPMDNERTLTALIQSGILIPDVQLEKTPGNWLVIDQLGGK